MLSQIIVSKCRAHLLLCRQEDIFTRHGLHLSRSTLCDWGRGAAELLRPLAALQQQRVLQSPVLWTDDTTVRLLDREANGGSRQARFWTYFGDVEHPYAVYDFTPSRARAGPAEFLQDYQGYLHADAYGAYDGIYLNSDGRIIEVARGTHIRRKFVDAQSAAPAENAQMVERFRQLYDREDRARDLTVAERAALRRPRHGRSWRGCERTSTSCPVGRCRNHHWAKPSRMLGINGGPSAATPRMAA